ncbi:alpha/beta fold hydrolase [Novosphingobium album (ex Liu et al. 2023)]|uniref:Alpha/beta hydrolase n=1 Tax=Novosphingobium album (ex Liu et al. 2023) TaxID=3031130 RepID=A0ABT5WUJ1_9SPHN|nr:alpha/beta hydrolase [Novosphingobium album (ex Liu et al. 2023)]MDE8653548.1 alpha/beta hydrolase [Novosphingobium album (ex Liu et al. 2023)]
MISLLGPTSNRFISQRLKLHYVDWGNADAPPLILQHGGRDHCRSWDWVAEELRHDWHVIAPDLRGHGDSEWSPEGHYGMDAYVYDFTQLIHTLGYDQVTIIAHSLGGNIATRFTGLYPDKVRKLVNIEGLGPAPEVRAQIEAPGLAQRMRQWIEDKRKSAGRVPRRYDSLRAAYERMKEENSFLTDVQARHLTIHGASRNEDGTWSWKFDNYLNVWPVTDIPYAEQEKLWQAITCPMLLFYGADSFASNPEKDGRIANFATARVIEYAKAGHWLHHDQFERFVADVKAFL